MLSKQITFHFAAKHVQTRFVFYRVKKAKNTQPRQSTINSCKLKIKKLKISTKFQKNVLFNVFLRNKEMSNLRKSNMMVNLKKITLNYIL